MNQDTFNAEIDAVLSKVPHSTKADYLVTYLRQQAPYDSIYDEVMVELIDRPESSDIIDDKITDATAEKAHEHEQKIEELECDKDMLKDDIKFLLDLNKELMPYDTVKLTSIMKHINDIKGRL